MPLAFVAGASGYSGRALVELLGRGESAWRARPQVRGPGRLDVPGTVIVDPFDVAAAAEAMQGCQAVVQLIGTTRQALPVVENPYEQIDYGATVALGQAAQKAGVRRFVFVSSVGAGTPRGRYLHWKREAETWLEASRLDWTIIRPSFIVGPGRRAPQLLLPLIGWSPALRPITAKDLARAIARALEHPELSVGQIFEGASLWDFLKSDKKK